MNSVPKFCRKCGAPITDETIRFCGKCGNPVTPQNKQHPAAEPSQTQQKNSLSGCQTDMGKSL